jgi:DNA polymerase elongation subunit (family B)
MSIVHNISSETVNCECCKTSLEAKIPLEVMQEINKELDNLRPWAPIGYAKNNVENLVRSWKNTKHKV